MGLTRAVTVAVATNVGNSRQNHEDNMITAQARFLTLATVGEMSANRRTVVDRVQHKPGAFLCAVSDGMGGHASGEIASWLSVKYLSEHYKQVLAAAKTGPAAIVQEVNRVNQAVCAVAKADPNCAGMGATLSGLVMSGRNLYGFHIGDSRIYRFCDGELIQLSVDHTEGQRLLNMGLLSREEVMKHPHRKAVCRYIGYDGPVEPDVFAVEVPKKGVFLLCSDGLTDVLSDLEIARILGNGWGLKERAELLVSNAVPRNPGHGDNVTVMLLEM